MSTVSNDYPAVLAAALEALTSGRPDDAKKFLDGIAYSPRDIVKRKAVPSEAVARDLAARPVDVPETGMG